MPMASKDGTNRFSVASMIGGACMIAIDKDASASAYWRAAGIVIEARARIPGPAHIGTEWWNLPISVTSAELGLAIRGALLAFQPDAPWPDFRSPEWKALRKIRLRAAGVTSERQYMTGSKLVHIDAAGENLVLTPTRNGGATGPTKGFEELTAASAAVSLAADDSRLGIAVTEAWARCI
jgi:hypothetical protein